MSGAIDDDLIMRARAVRIEREIERRGIKLRGHVERCGPCPRCGGSDRFGINIKKQLWNCRGCDIGGNVIALAQHLDRVDFATAVQMLAGGCASSSGGPAVTAPRSAATDDYARDQHRKAAWLWSRRRPIAGTPAQKYLREVRGIDCTLPATLGFLPPTKPGHHPALIAAYDMPDEPEPGILAEPRNVDAVHLVLLKPDGAGKADVKPDKITIGSPGGLPIVLAPPNNLLGLAVAEGIEDALSLHQTTELGAWAAGAASFMPAFADAVPAYIECVTIAVDDDNSGCRYAAELAARLSERSFHVEFLELIG